MPYRLSINISAIVLVSQPLPTVTGPVRGRHCTYEQNTNSSSHSFVQLTAHLGLQAVSAFDQLKQWGSMLPDLQCSQSTMKAFDTGILACARMCEVRACTSSATGRRRLHLCAMNSHVCCETLAQLPRQTCNAPRKRG